MERQMGTEDDERQTGAEPGPATGSSAFRAPRSEFRKTRVGVIFGGRSGEHDVSLRSARAVMAALDPARYEVVPIGITRQGQWIAGGDPLQQLEAGSELARLEGRTQETGDHAADAEPGAGRELATTASNTPTIFTGERGPIDVIFPVLHGPRGEDGTV